MSNRPVSFGDFLLIMAEQCEQGGMRRDQVIDCLQQVDEAFTGELDPAYEFEAYAAWRLCRAVKNALKEA